MIRAQLTEVLALLGTRHGQEWARPLLVALCDDPVDYVRYDALMFLRFFPDDETVRLLRDRMKTTGETDEVKSAARSAYRCVRMERLRLRVSPSGA